MQDAAYRDTILPPGCRARLAVEAAATMSWYRWVGEDGDILGMEGFGASAPQPDLYEHFGFTPENVAARARSVVERKAEPLMQIGFIGLGRMGGNMVHRILRDSGHEVVAWDPAAAAVQEAVGHGSTAARSRSRTSWRSSSRRATSG